MELYRTLCLLTVCLGASLGFADDLPPGVENTQDPNDVSLTPEESLSRMVVPDGFHVTQFAAEPDIRRPIAFDFDDRGRLWVVENYAHPVWKEGAGQDRIVILEDHDQDGIFDKRTVFWDKGRYLSGIAYGHGGVWIGNAPELSFIPDANRDDVPDSDPIVKLDGFQVTQNNMLNNFHWGPDGWLYGAIGFRETGYIGPPGAGRDERVSMTRGIWRYHPQRGEFEKVATGMVNPWGADFNAWGDLITSNTVIAHLWHIVPGMHAQRRGADIEYPYAYEYIQSIADHLHWGGGRWQDSRETTQQHSVAGGGHAHCGGMIYLGDNWPEAYRGTFFTGNLHGNRLNNDQLIRRGSSYVATHRPDFLFAHDAWFRSLTQKYGPDGGVFLTDWHDFGECHDQDGSHRTSGRIYKVIYGTPAKQPLLDLQQSSSEELVELHTHRNAWFVRRARRILQARGISDTLRQTLKAKFREAETTEQRLCYLWTLYVTKSLDEADLLALTQDPDEHLRRWAVTLLVDTAKPLDVGSPWTAANSNPPNRPVRDALMRLAHDRSPIVRLAVACSLRRVPANQRWELVQALANNEQDATDAYIPLLTWYATEPLVATDIPRALTLAETSQLSTLTRLIARRAADVSSQGVELVLDKAANTATAHIRDSLLRGLLASVKIQPSGSVPKGWEQAKARLQALDDVTLNSLTAQLAVAFGDPEMVATLRRTLKNRSVDTAERCDALRSLARIPDSVTVADLLGLLDGEDELRSAAIPLLKKIGNDRSAKRLLEVFDRLTALEQADALDAMIGQATSARLLLSAIEDGRVPRRAVSAYALHALRSIPHQEVQQHVTRVFGEPEMGSKEAQIGQYKQRLTPDFLADADLSKGRQLFDATCAKCHRLFGEGSDFAPDLTGSGRRDLDYLLSNLIDPNGLVAPSYRVTHLVAESGRMFSGFLLSHSERAVTLKTPDGNVTVPHADVEVLQTTTQSMMPEGLLQSYTDEQTRDLVGYLMSPDPVE